MLQKLVGELRHVDSLRSQFDLIVARFIRWCALHASGGGWMSDYDVLNIGFTPEAANINKTVVLSSKKPHLFYTSPEYAQYVINKFLSEDLVNENGIRSESDILGIEPVEFDSVIHAVHSKESPKSSSMSCAWEANLSQAVS